MSVSFTCSQTSVNAVTVKEYACNKCIKLPCQMFGKICAPDLLWSKCFSMTRGWGLKDALHLLVSRRKKVVGLLCEYYVSGLHKSMVSSYLAEEKQWMAKIKASSFLECFYFYISQCFGRIRRMWESPFILKNRRRCHLTCGPIRSTGVNVTFSSPQLTLS